MSQAKLTYFPLNGLLLCLTLLSLWALTHIYSVFFHALNAPIYVTIGLIALQCWLYTGLFICAHDAMHGTLAPRNQRLNDALGRIILFYYAGFHFSKMKSAHMAHHKYPGTEKDPDFNAKNPYAFWPWYLKFFTTYFGLSQFLTVLAITIAYLLLGASYLNTIIMWALPAILSSFQLFYFGTYLTHKHIGSDFPDAHNARTNDYPVWLSLLTCFHFGYHHEHHLYPHIPWWRLPAMKRKAAHVS